MNINNVFKENDYILVVIAIMIAVSKSEEKEIMVNLVMNFLV